MAWLLVLDTCGEGGGVGVVRVDGSLGTLAAERSLPGRETQERLMTALEESLAEAGIGTANLSAIAVVHGPGSFTGVRIGLAAAKGLTEALAIPLLTISRLEVLASRWGVLHPGEEDATVQAWLDAGRGDVFVGRYRGEVCEDESMQTGAAAVEFAGAGPVLVMEEKVAALLPRATRVGPVGVREAMLPALRKLAAKEFADTPTVEANYLRVPDAQLALQARQCA